MVRSTIVGVLVFLALPGSANAQGQYALDTGNDLLRMCSDDAEFPQRTMCSGFLDGVVQQAEFLAVYNKTEKPFCRPERASRRQMQKVVLNFIDAHPESSHLPAAGLATIALRDAFPCEVE